MCSTLAAPKNASFHNSVMYTFMITEKKNATDFTNYPFFSINLLREFSYL